MSKSSRRRIKMSKSSNSISSGVGFGSAIAITISWSINHSIWWAIGHGICSWGYVIFYAAGWTNK